MKRNPAKEKRRKKFLQSELILFLPSHSDFEFVNAQPNVELYM